MPGALESLLVLFSAVAAIFWLFVLVDCLRNEPSEGNEKVIWVVVILLTNFIGAVLYLALRRPKRIAQYGK
ncbi:MAG: PLDc_N domain-containing protein [Calditrichaeota bacterium]|nr:MAG: PLDc_N domain-containing protein [Calditrichota bacterium]